MDQIKIGKFIASARKEKGYTQKQLSEILEISDKTISKWETGKGFPEISLLMPLCNALNINVNELLSGERLAETDYKKKAEENMVNLVQEKQESKKRIILSAVVSCLTVISGVMMIVMAGVFEMSTWLRVVIIAISCVVFAGGIAVACVLDQEAGAFKCPVCEKTFVPGMKEYIMGLHTITKRKLTCPKCGKTNYCKKVLTK